MSVEHNEAPVIGGVTAVQEAYNENLYAIKVTVSNITDADQGDTIKSFSFSVNGGDPTVVEYANMIDNGDGSYSYYIEQLTPEDVGEYTVSAVVEDSNGAASESVSAPVLVIEDVTPPDMVDLGMGLEDQKLVVTQVGQTVTFTWDVPYDNVGVMGYNVWFDGYNGGAFTVYTNSCSTSDLEVGYWHSITIEAFDAAGNVGQEGATKYPIQVHDYTAPTKGAVDLSQVQDGYQVTITLADWSDNVAITAFDFMVDGNPVEFEDLGEGVYALYLTDEDIGDHEISVTAYDEEGNSTVEVTPFTVADTTAPVVGTLALEQAADSQVVTATLDGWSDNVGITSFQFYVGSDEIEASKVTKISDTEYQLDMTEYGLGEFSVSAWAKDAAGNSGSNLLNPTVIALEDHAAPVIGEVHFVQNGFNAVATLSGLSDNVGIEGLTFTINETAIEYEDQGNGSYLLTLGEEYVGENTVVIRAFDAAGNETSIEAVLTLGDDEYDDWGDMATLGPEGTVGNIGVLNEETQFANAVGTDDPKDYMAFTLESAANLSFTVESANAIKFSINKLVAPTKAGGKYTLKSLQSTSLKAGQSLNTKALLLDLENGEPTTYYIGVESADKNVKGAYSFSTAKSTFFTNGDNSDDTYDGEGVGAFEESWDGWVGYGDAIDYTTLELANAASVTFDVSSTDAGKFTIWTYDAKSKKLKSLQATSTKLDKKLDDPQNNVATTKALLLEAGTYYLSMENTNAKKGGSGDYTVVRNAKYTVFDQGDNSDDTYNGEGVQAFEESWEGWVGYGDATDYSMLTLANAASVTFDVSSSDAGKFTIWTLDTKTNKLKSLQATSTKLDKKLDAPQNNVATTKALLLQAGTYYLSMENTNAKKGGSGDYTVVKNDKYKVFDQGDNSDDTYNGEGVQAFEESCEGWVGYGDATDFTTLELANAASVTFDVSSSDAAKFTIWTLDAKNKLKSLQATSTKLDKKLDSPQNNVATTKALLLQAGTYYLSVENTNAKKGGSGDYTVMKNDKYAVFDQGDNSDDTYNGEGVGEFAESWEGWVGYGDATDFTTLTLDSAANLVFDVSSSDAGKFTVWTVDPKTNKLKSLQATSTKLDKKLDAVQNNVATTKALLVEAGTYYLSMENTNAKKGGSGDYTVILNNDKTVFFTKGDNSDDWGDMKANGAAGAVGIITEPVVAGATLVNDGWVGYSDSIDYMAFTLAGATTNLQFELTATDAAKFTVYQLQGSAGKYSLKSLQSTAVKANVNATTKALKLAAGTYYLAMESTNAKKGGSVDYTINVKDSTTIDSQDLVEGDNEGTDKADVILASTTQAIGQVTMLAGNDQLLLAKDTTLGFTLIDMGEGDDVISVGSGASLVATDQEGIVFGNGDDSLFFTGTTLNSSVDMGAGNDTVNFNLATDLDDFARSLTLGEGDDAVSISGGFEASFATITFGAGEDTLNIGADTRLVVTGAFDVEGLETLNMAESATLVLNDQDSFNAAQNKFAGTAGMNIVNA